MLHTIQKETIQGSPFFSLGHVVIRHLVREKREHAGRVIQYEHASVALEFACGHGVLQRLGLGDAKRLEPRADPDPCDVYVEIGVEIGAEVGVLRARECRPE